MDGFILNNNKGGSNNATTVGVKTVTYRGTGTNTRAITFPEKPTLIISIQFTNDNSGIAGIIPFHYGNPAMFCMYKSSAGYGGGWSGTYTSSLAYSADELTMTISGSDKGAAWNDNTKDYVVYYI